MSAAAGIRSVDMANDTGFDRAGGPGREQDAAEESNDDVHAVEKSSTRATARLDRAGKRDAGLARRGGRRFTASRALRPRPVPRPRGTIPQASAVAERYPLPYTPRGRRELGEATPRPLRLLAHRRPQAVVLPKGARIAVWTIVNIEEW